jgi:hypothetical protein
MADANSPRDVEPTADLVLLGSSADLAHRRRCRSLSVTTLRGSAFLQDLLEKSLRRGL